VVRRAWYVLLPALVLGLVMASSAAASSRLAASSSGPSSKAAAINLIAGDLSSSIKWASSPQPTNNKAEDAAGKKAAACLDKAGAATADPFGTSEVLGGSVLADVRSPQFYDKASSLTQLPAANTEVVIVKTATEASKDLAAIRQKSSLSCLGAQYKLDSVQSGSGNVSIAESFMSAPRHGDGNGGVHIRFAENGGLLPQTLYNDEYFYAEGPVEVVFSFLNLGSPFDSGWADAALTKVMQRAAQQAG
jgi:hypothetical protein